MSPPGTLGGKIQTAFAASFVSTDLPDATSADFANIPDTKWCLLELPKDQLEKLEKGGDFHFRAFGSDGEARLCSDTSTFGCEFLENSNSLLVGVLEQQEPTSAQDPETDMKGRKCSVFAQCQGHMFLKAAMPDGQYVREVLAKSVWGSTGARTPSQVTPEFLAHKVAASPKELKKILDDGPYLQHQGCWYKLSEQFANEVVDVALSVIKANGWSIAAVSFPDLLQQTEEHLAGSAVTEQVLRKALWPLQQGEKLATPEETGAKKIEADTLHAEVETMALDETKVVQFQALQLLRQNPGAVRARFQLQQLSQPRAKRAKIATSAYNGRDPGLSPEELTHALQQLTGQTVSESELAALLGQNARLDVADDSLHLLDVAALPLDVKERARRLFELQTHWKPDQLQDLFSAMMSEKEVKIWLHKNTRTVFVEVNETEVPLLTKKFAGL